MGHEDFKEMIPARALSALDTAEDRVLTDHLAECAECQRDLYEWQLTAASLALTADPTEPSAAVRERILAQIRNVNAASHSSNVIPFAPPQRNLWSSFGSLGAIAATVIFLALLAYVVVLYRENRALRTETQRLAAQFENTQHELEFAKLIQQPGAKFAELTGMPVAPAANAKLVYSQSGHAMVMTEGLPAAPADKEYQLWFIVADKPPMRGKTFSIDSRGKGVMEDQVPSEAIKSAVFAITLEPKGGSQTPTMPIYLRGSS